MIDVVYMGFSSVFLQVLSGSNQFHVTKVVSIKHRITPELERIIDEHNYPCLTLFTKDDMRKVSEFVSGSSLILIHEFDYILSEDLIKQHMVINLHTGSLYTNRGAHPLVWSILNQDPDTCLSTYQLTGGIDEGILINEYSIPILDSDNTGTLKNKLVKGFPMALEAIQQYLTGQLTGTGVYGGIYSRKVTEQDYTIDPKIDSVGIAYAKIRSQICYNGAIYRDNKTVYRVKGVTVDTCDNIDTSFSFHDSRLIITGEGRRIVCICTPLSYEDQD